MSHDTPDGPVAATPGATSELRRAFDAATRRWPALGVDFARFSGHLEQLGYAETNLPRHPSELYLCVGCGLGTVSACRALELTYLKGLRARLRSVASEQDFAEEVLQRVRARLLVGSKPRINTYRGDGPLGAWLHVVAANVARDYLRSHKRRRSSCGRLDAGSARFASSGDPSAVAASPEDDVLAANYARTFEDGLVKATLELTSEERQLLHHYFVSGLSIDVLGSMYSINRSTAARRIQRNIERIRYAVRRELSRSAIGSTELATLWPTLGKRLNVNASSLLGLDAQGGTLKQSKRASG